VHFALGSSARQPMMWLSIAALVAPLISVHDSSMPLCEEICRTTMKSFDARPGLSRPELISQMISLYLSGVPGIVPVFAAAVMPSFPSPSASTMVYPLSFNAVLGSGHGPDAVPAGAVAPMRMGNDVVMKLAPGARL